MDVAPARRACQASIPRTTRAGWPSTSEPSPSGRRKRERGVVEAEEVQQGGVVVGVSDDVLDRLVAELVGLAVDVAGLEAAAGEPHAEAVGVVIAADVLLVLDHRQAAHLAAPVDDGRVEQPALLEVLDQRGATGDRPCGTSGGVP